MRPAIHGHHHMTPWSSILPSLIPHPFSKFPHYSQLTEKYNIHVHGVSETSATQIAQKAFQAKMKQIQMQSLWSQLVAAHTARLDQKESYRGKASGVSVFTKFPLRRVEHTISEELCRTSRLVHEVIHFGGFHIQIVQIYCLPKMVEGSLEFNNRLLSAAYQAIQHLPIPTILMGDLMQNLILSISIRS